MKTLKTLFVSVVVLLSISIVPSVFGQETIEPQKEYDRVCYEIEKFMMDYPIEPTQLGDPIARFFSNIFVNVMTACQIAVGHNEFCEVLSFFVCAVIYFICFLPVSLPTGIIYSFGLLFLMIPEDLDLAFFIENFGLVFGLPMIIGLALLFLPIALVFTTVFCIPVGAWVMNKNFENAWRWAYNEVYNGSSGAGIPKGDK